MKNDDFQKLAHFLQEYLDIYGDDIFVDRHRFDKMMKDIPKLDVTAKTEAAPEEIEPTVVSDAAKAETPLWKFKNEIKDCTKCPLGHTRLNFVFGDGSENADILFIGEAPGAEEDRTGIPFVGRAGQLLNKLLSHIKIKREEVFIANILKCRPPGNRDPQPDEVEKCTPYLHKQIEVIQPKIIVSLGRVAAQNLLNTTSSLKQLRGRLWQYQGFDMIVTYHPAAILRNMGLFNTIIEDFKYINSTYQQKLTHQT
jgi:DNA polymerase